MSLPFAVNILYESVEFSTLDDMWRYLCGNLRFTPLVVRCYLVIRRGFRGDIQIRGWLLARNTPEFAAGGYSSEDLIESHSPDICVVTQYDPGAMDWIQATRHDIIYDYRLPRLL